MLKKRDLVLCWAGNNNKSLNLFSIDSCFQCMKSSRWICRCRIYSRHTCGWRTLLCPAQYPSKSLPHRRCWCRRPLFSTRVVTVVAKMGAVMELEHVPTCLSTWICGPAPSCSNDRHLHSLLCLMSLPHTSEWLIFACNGFLSLLLLDLIWSTQDCSHLFQMHVVRGVSLPFESYLQYGATKKAELRTEVKSQGLGRGETQRW